MHWRDCLLLLLRTLLLRLAQECVCASDSGLQAGKCEHSWDQRMERRIQNHANNLRWTLSSDHLLHQLVDVVADVLLLLELAAPLVLLSSKELMKPLLIIDLFLREAWVMLD